MCRDATKLPSEGLLGTFLINTLKRLRKYTCVLHGLDKQGWPGGPRGCLMVLCHFELKRSSLYESIVSGQSPAGEKRMGVEKADG